jgi:hypothetical protein
MASWNLGKGDFDCEAASVASISEKQLVGVLAARQKVQARRRTEVTGRTHNQKSSQ